MKNIRTAVLNIRTAVLIGVLIAMGAVPVIGQVHKFFSPGTVWTVTMIKMASGMDQSYLQYLDGQFKKAEDAQIKAGFEKSYKILRTMDDGGATIRLPAPRVMHVFVNDNETKVWDRSKTWWTPWVAFNPELEQNARRAALEAVQQAALQMGILSNAQQNAETTIREFLLTVGMTNVVFSKS